MSKTAMIRARVEPDLKEEAEAVLKELGLSATDLITMTYRQLVMRRALPFEAKIPNAETIAALEESDRDYAAGRLKQYSGENAVREMFDDILAEDD